MSRRRSATLWRSALRRGWLGLWPCWPFKVRKRYQLAFLLARCTVQRISPIFLVSSVTSDPGTGISVTYTYQWVHLGNLFSGDIYSGPELVRVTQADGTFVSFTYDQSLRITTVSDTNDKVLEQHTYADACNAGLSSSRANGVDALTLYFPNMQWYCSFGGVGARGE